MEINSWEAGKTVDPERRDGRRARMRDEVRRKIDALHDFLNDSSHHGSLTRRRSAGFRFLPCLTARPRS